MIVLRSILFNMVFYANLIVQMIVLTPIYFLLPRKKAWFVPKNWVRSNHWLLEKMVGTTFEIEGLENLPDVPYIFAPSTSPSGMPMRCFPGSTILSTS